MYSRELKHRATLSLNENYGENLLDLDMCLKLKSKLLEEKSALIKEVNFKTDCSLGNTVYEAEQLVQNTQDLICKSRNTLQCINEDLDEVDDVRKNFDEYSLKINQLQCTLQYMNVINQIEFLGSELQKEVAKGDDEKCATLYANLTEISRNLNGITATNLLDYLKDVVYYWHNILKDKFSNDFDEVLKTIKWPFVSTNFSLVIPSQTQIQKLQTIAEYLFQIEIPSENYIPTITSALLSDFPPLCLPIHYLVMPLRKRFNYHFYGARQTNRADKPEWYFTQILTWIRDHSDFIEKYIQPVIDKLGLHYIVAKMEFIRGLVQIAVEKLHSELPTIQYDDFIFSHSIDEALGFEKELRETYEYLPNQPSILGVLTQARVFVKWLAMEKKYAIEKMDTMLPPNSSDAFEPIASDVEQLKITTCADAFITLLQSITDRYESLQQPGHRLQFLELQLELLDDFRIRLLQLVNADAEEGDIFESRIPSIANSIYYIENVLVDWGAMLHYLNLYYYKSQIEGRKEVITPTRDLDEKHIFDIDTDSVFAETLSLYKRMRIDILNNLAATLIEQVKNKSRAYCRKNWSILKVDKEFRTLSLSPNACPMFDILSKGLHQSQKCLQKKLFTYVWQSVARQVDSYLFEDLILENRFSEGGALQFKFDISRNMIPLFSQYCECPENYFTQITESCNLLTLSKGSAILMKETLRALEGATGVEDTRSKTLKEVGVKNFQPYMALKILERRADLTINRIIID